MRGREKRSINSASFRDHFTRYRSSSPFQECHLLLLLQYILIIPLPLCLPVLLSRDSISAPLFFCIVSRFCDCRANLRRQMLLIKARIHSYSDCEENQFSFFLSTCLSKVVNHRSAAQTQGYFLFGVIVTGSR